VNISRIDSFKTVVVDPHRADYMPLVASKRPDRLAFSFLRTGESCLNLGFDAVADLWIIHLQLPDMNGLECYDLVRHRIADAPVLIVADEFSPADELAILSRGVLRYVTKPVSSAWFRVLLDELLAQRTAMHSALSPPASDTDCRPQFAALTR
jgi:DNA-binding response OmpR family regulator